MSKGSSARYYQKKQRKNSKKVSWKINITAEEKKQKARILWGKI